MTMAPIAASASKSFQRRHDLAEHLRIQRIQRLRAVERDQADLAARLDQERFVGHCRFLLFSASFRASAGRPGKRTSIGRPGRCAGCGRRSRACGRLRLPGRRPRKRMLEIAERSVGPAHSRAATSRRPRSRRQSTERIALASRLRARSRLARRGWRSCRRRGAAKGRRATALPRRRYCPARRSAAGRAEPLSAASFLPWKSVCQQLCRPARCRSARRRGPTSIGCSPESSANSMKPKRLGSLKTTRDRCRPARRARWKTTWSCAGFPRPLVVEGAGRRCVRLPVSIRNDPDIPRWQIRSGPPSIVAVRYLARRPSETIRRPDSRSAKFSGSGNRRSGRRASTLRMRAPSMTGCRPRRTVSTSGSSGMAGEWPRERNVPWRPGGRPRCSATVSPMSAKVGRRPTSPPASPGTRPMTGTRSRV